ncbi:unnamed protein product, partial [Ectocarpus sp. 12 AP-2014]
AGWGRSVTPNGELYYVNHVSKTTTWSRPQWTTGSDGDEECESRDTKTLSEQLDVFALGSHECDRRAGCCAFSCITGWEERMSAEGKVFYMNHNDKTTHWTRPDPP